MAERMHSVDPSMPQFRNLESAPIPRGMPLLRPLFSGIGLNTPTERFLGVGAISAAVILTVKPSFAFAGDKARPFRAWSADPDATYFTWHVAALSVAAVTAFFT